MSRKLDAVKNLALHPGTGETEWQAAAIAYFRILRANGGKEPVDKPQGVRMEHPMHQNPDPWYPFGQASAKADAEARTHHHFYKSPEEQAREAGNLRRQREDNAARKRRDAEEEFAKWKEGQRKKDEENKFSKPFSETWSGGVRHETATEARIRQENAEIARRVMEDIYRRANGG